VPGRPWESDDCGIGDSATAAGALDDPGPTLRVADPKTLENHRNDPSDGGPSRARPTGEHHSRPTAHQCRDDLGRLIGTDAAIGQDGHAATLRRQIHASRPVAHQIGQRGAAVGCRTEIADMNDETRSRGSRERQRCDGTE
jgi:hypothetical protein